MDITFQNSSLAAFLAISAYLAFLCYTPPTPPPSNPVPQLEDRLSQFNSMCSRNTRRIIPLILLSAYHIILVLFPSHHSNICLHPDLLNEKLFSWSWRTIVYFFIIFTLAPLRLSAYSQLGKNFTFRLAVPTGLVTTGIYRYVQHPSYIGLIGVRVASMFLLERLDGGLVCLVPQILVWITQRRGLSEVMLVGVTAITAGAFWIRVKDEKKMLKKEFGKEWETWHAKTKRFIPGII